MNKEKMKDKPPPSYKYFAHKWVRSQTTRGYVSPYATPPYPALRRYRSMVEPSPPVVSSTSPPLPDNPRTRSYLSSLNPNPHQYVSPYSQPTMSPPPSRSQRTKRTRKNGPSKSNKPSVLPPPISPTSPPPPSPPQQPQDPRYSFTYILNSPTPPIHIHRHNNPTHSLKCLPEKVRHLIWSYARSRTISITISDDLIYSRSPSPITFRINRESRSATINHYSVHPQFFILDTQNKNKNERIHYPFFDPSVDSMVLNDVFMGCDSALSSNSIFGFYDSDTREVMHRKREVLDYAHFNVLQSLHIPARAWDWNRIRRVPRAEIRFRNLTEIVLEGGAMGLRTRKDVKMCEEFIRGCFERTVEEIAEEEEIDDTDGMELASHGTLRIARIANMEIKVPEVRVIMPNGLDHEWMFEDQLGMESMEERTWVMNFISKVKAGR
ncbi:hypothetical protein BCON_0278g00030 [Botryotinia convoluta]|uniref:2EXR domain-containing protein n=1 Tax=Botryotinia convoluta TaxID=54673 RepID=A0A4Z1HEA5_9HELO|nr:hypothetical protein BCON_0278g00030 [Botryotinia convoluta]